MQGRDCLSERGRFCTGWVALLVAVATSLLLSSLSHAADSTHRSGTDGHLTDWRLDDTAGFIHLTPNPDHALCGTPFSIALIATLTDARVFELRFLVDEDFLQVLSVTPGSDTSLHILPEQVLGDTLWLDGFFHPNFTGTISLATLTLYPVPIPADDTTEIGFLDGRGYSGTPESPGLIILSGDTSTAYIDCTPPQVPWEMIIVPIDTDSVCLRWHPIFYDVDGDTVIDPLYVIYRTDQLMTPTILDSIGATLDTFFYDDYIQVSHPRPPDSTGVVSGTCNATTYEVRARKTQPNILLSPLRFR